MERSILHWVCVCALVALPVGGCSDETTGTGGSGGSGDTGGDGGEGGIGGMGGLPECESAGDCDDENECTDNACGAGMCEFDPVPDGTLCDQSNECSVSMCAEGICPLVADDTACGDDAGTCQQGSCRVACDEQGIRDAIAAGGGPYTFACDGPTTVVTEAEIVIDNDVVLDGGGNLTVDGNDDHRVFEVERVTAELRGFVVTNGVGEFGGGIYNYGTLTLTNSTVSENSATEFGGGIYNIEGTLTLTNSTVSENIADGSGGGIFNCGTLTLTNSTVSGNSAPVGDGILNSKDPDPLGVCNVDPPGALTLMSSVIDGGCGGCGDITSNGYNMESPGNTCGFGQPTDQVDVTEGQLNLGPLQDNGGGTQTHALGAGSVAIDAIPADMCEVDEDQRGEPRDSMCDVGAFEVQP